MGTKWRHMTFAVKSQFSRKSAILAGTFKLSEFNRITPLIPVRDCSTRTLQHGTRAGMLVNGRFVIALLIGDLHSAAIKKAGWKSIKTEVKGSTTLVQMPLSVQRGPYY